MLQPEMRSAPHRQRSGNPCHSGSLQDLQRDASGSGLCIYQNRNVGLANGENLQSRAAVSPSTQEFKGSLAGLGLGSCMTNAQRVGTRVECLRITQFEIPASMADADEGEKQLTTEDLLKSHSLKVPCALHLLLRRLSSAIKRKTKASQQLATCTGHVNMVWPHAVCAAGHPKSHDRQLRRGSHQHCSGGSAQAQAVQGHCLLHQAAI